MRVLFDYQAFTLQSQGGISRYVLELGAQMAAQPEVDPRLYAGWHRSRMLVDAAPTWAVGRYVRPWPNTGPLRRALNSHLTRRFVRTWKPDIVHETYFRNGPAHATGVPTVLTLYDLIYFVLPTVDANAASARRAQHAAIARANHIICISEQTRRDLHRFITVDPARVSVVPLAGPPPRPADVPLPAPPESEGPYLLHVGLRHSYKNFDVLLRALAKAPRLQSHFRLVAFGDRPFTPQETARIRALGLAPSRIIHRTGGDRLLESYYAHATALVCPSLYEGFGLPPLEAMAQGCPVVCSNRGSLPEVMADAGLGFNPEKPGELAEILQSLADSPVLADELRRRGLAQAARFSWKKCADDTLAIYRRLAG